MVDPMYRDLEPWTDEEAEQYDLARGLMLSQISVCVERNWPCARRLVESRLNDLDSRDREGVAASIAASTEWLQIFDREDEMRTREQRESEEAERGVDPVMDLPECYEVTFTLDGDVETHTLKDVADVRWDDLRYTIILRDGRIKFFSVLAVSELTITPIYI